MSRIEVEIVEGGSIEKNQIVSVVEYDAMEEIEIVKVRNNVWESRIKKLNKETYLCLETGEIKKFKKNIKKDMKNLKKSMSNLRKTIRKNFNGDESERFITLTEIEDIKDIKDIKEDLKKFNKKLMKKYGNYKIVAVFERGEENKRWHTHMLVKAIDNQKVKFKDKEINELWGKGLAKVERIDNIDKVASYMTKSKTKEEIPVGEKAYFKSRNVVKAEKEIKIYDKEKVSKEFYLKNTLKMIVRDKETSKIVNIIEKQFWKKKQ